MGLTVEELEQWAAAGAHWRLLELVPGGAQVEMCACTGERVEVRRGDDPVLLSFLARVRSDEERAGG